MNSDFVLIPYPVINFVFNFTLKVAEYHSEAVQTSLLNEKRIACRDNVSC